MIRTMLRGAVLPLALQAGQDVLHPHSSAEHRITVLWWVMLAGAWVGFALVAILLLLGWFRRRQASLPFGGNERVATRLVVALGIATPIVVLTGLFVWSDIFVVRSTAAPNASSTSLTVKVTGHQWFWEIQYPGQRAVTANELHIPVDTRVDVVGKTADVIHSLWVPELNRKIDLIPGRENSVLLDANRVGTYLGQCSEFCGLQHAHMELIVVVEPRSRFEQWLHGEESNARQPRGAAAERGLAVFMSAGCADCHRIRGTAAGSRVGPDLTHLAARSTLAAGTIANDRAGLARWLRDPQGVKPGNKMPALPLKADELAALVAYLQGLK
jgi:cytochrome c oxidase subunit 2